MNKKNLEEFILETVGSDVQEISNDFLFIDTIWMTQKGMAKFFGVSVATINQHLKGLYVNDELSQNSTIREFLIVQKERKNEKRVRKLSDTMIGKDGQEKKENPGFLAEIEKIKRSQQMQRILLQSKGIIQAKTHRTPGDYSTIDRDVERVVKFYNFDAVISVGYRVRSSQAKLFRKWATKALQKYVTF